MTPFVWKDRLVKIEEGCFVISAKGKHDDFNYCPPRHHNDMAVAGNPGMPVTSLEISEDGELLINSRFKMSGNGCDDYRIEETT